MAVIMSKQMAIPTMARRLGDYAVGESVLLNVNGTPTEFLVANQGIPSNSSYYGASCDNTWLIASKPYTKVQFDKETSVYPNSNIHKYAVGTFLGLLDTEVQNTIVEASIPYAANRGRIESMTAKIFIPSATEMNRHAVPDHVPPGGKLSIVDAGYTLPYEIWCRSVQSSGSGGAIYLYTSAAVAVITYSYGFLPVLILPYDTLFDPDTSEFLGVK